MMIKLKINANIDGIICLSASQRSAVVLIFFVGGILTSMISNVSAMANTPSQKASRREVSLDSDMACFH